MFIPRCGVLDFISLTLPPDRQILAWFGLAALDGGLLCWLLGHRFGSHGGWQRGISLAMIVVDLLGACLMFTADTLYNSGELGLTSVMAASDIQSIVLALSAIIALNIAAVVAHHLTDPAQLKQSAEEEAFAAIEDKAIAAISKNADQLAAQLAPEIANDWMKQTRARYLAALSDGGNALGLPSGSQPTVNRVPVARPAMNAVADTKILEVKSEKLSRQTG